jgi:hypothetical protein
VLTFHWECCPSAPSKIDQESPIWSIDHCQAAKNGNKLNTPQHIVVQKEFEKMSQILKILTGTIEQHVSFQTVLTFHWECCPSAPSKIEQESPIWSIDHCQAAKNGNKLKTPQHIVMQQELRKMSQILMGIVSASLYNSQPFFSFWLGCPGHAGRQRDKTKRATAASSHVLAAAN